MPRLISRKLIGLLSLLIPTVALAVQVSPYLKAGRMDVDNIRLDGNTVSTLNTNGSLTFDLNGTGGVLFTDLTATTVPYLDAGKKIQSSAVTPTELGYLSGVTVSLCGTSQACTLTNKTIDGDNNTVQDLSNSAIKAAAAIDLNKLAAVTASRALASDGSGFVSASSVTSTELGYLSGVTMSLCGTGQSCTLSNKTLTAPVIDAVTFDDQASAPSSPSSGNYKFYVKTDGTAYVLNSSGIETAVGVGGGTNEQSEYITNGKFESATTGWATYADAASSSPADGTGGSPTATIARTTTAGEILKGTASLEFAKPASNEQGEGFSYDFTVDPENYSNLRPVYLSFDYKTTSNYASSDIKVFVYDKDAAAVLGVVDADNLAGALPASTGGRRFTGVFYPTTSTSNDYRLIFHVTSTNASAYDFHVDSVHAGSQVTTPSAIITDWTSFTPTGSWSTNSTYTGRWRRVGDSMEVIVNISLAGAPTSTGLTVNLPSGYTIDTNKIVAQAGTIGSLGHGSAADSGVATYGLVVHYNTTTSVAVYAQNAASTYLFHSTSQVTQALPFTFGSPDQVEINFKVPISNWTSGASVSTTEMLQSTAVAQATGDPASASSGNIIIIGTENYDTHSAYNTSTGQFTAPKSARYRIHGALLSANAGIGLFVYPNGSGASAIQVGTTDSNGEATFSGTIYAAKGTTLDLRPNGTVDAAANTIINYEEIPDFSVFSVYGSFELKTTTSSVKTPSADGFHDMTSNSIDLTTGTWRLTCNGDFSNSGTPAYSAVGIDFYGGDGANSGSVPTALSSVVTVLSPKDSTAATYLAATLGDTVRTSAYPTIVRCASSSCTIYCVPYSVQTTDGSARVTIYATAERLQ